jgi:indolepyruvate ferredoxin oxidoreductase alpha subunit
VKNLAHKHKYHHIEIHGKDYLPLAGELNTQLVLNAFSQLIAKPQLARYIERCMGYPPKSEREHKHPLPPLPRPPVLCPGCAHRAVFYAINLATATFSQRSAPRKFTVVKPSDIGCYTLGYQPPLNAVDVHFCMGASIGIATGLAKALEPERHLIVCTIGDSTFFHAGIPPLLNAVFNQANITIVILDNETTAMTGYQPHPGVGYTATGAATKKLRVETIVRACGVDYVKIVDAYKLSKLITAIEGAIRYEGPSVVIARHPCRMLELQKLRAAGVKLASMYIDKAVCVNCMRCINKFGCPAMCIEDLPEAKRQVKINSTLCNGCGVCMDKHICSKRAIKRMPTASN